MYRLLRVVALALSLSHASALSLTIFGAVSDGCDNEYDHQVLLEAAEAALVGSNNRKLRGQRMLPIQTCDTFSQCMIQYNNIWMCRITCRRRRQLQGEWGEGFEWNDLYTVDNLSAVSHILTKALQHAPTSEGCNSRDVIATVSAV